jgi:hypothetical protein
MTRRKVNRITLGLSASWTAPANVTTVAVTMRTDPDLTFINRVIFKVTPGQTYTFDYFLTQIGLEIMSTSVSRTSVQIDLEYYT